MSHISYNLARGTVILAQRQKEKHVFNPRRTAKALIVRPVACFAPCFGGFVRPLFVGFGNVPVNHIPRQANILPCYIYAFTRYGQPRWLSALVAKYPLFGAGRRNRILLFASLLASQKRQIIVKRNAPYRDRAFSNTEKDQYPLGGLVITGLYLAGSKYKATA